MTSVNRVILVGNLGKDPEVRALESGKRVASFSIVTSEKYGDKETTTWHNIVLWEKLAEVAEKFLKKGSSVYLEGKISNRSYDDKDGVKKYVSEIIGSSLTMLGNKPSSGDTPAAKAEDSAKSYMDKTPANSTPETAKKEVFADTTFNSTNFNEGDDDLPF